MESKSVKSVAVKKEKRVKDPEAPKREKPTLSAKEITAELGTKWQSLKSNSPDLLKKYESLASDDKSRYASEKASYVVKSSVPASTPAAQSVEESAPVVVKKASRSKKGSVAVEVPVVPPPVVHEVPAVVPVPVDAEVVDAKQSRRKKKV